jgi:soluble lytic murein transglycosylase-like protein
MHNPDVGGWLVHASRRLAWAWMCALPLGAPAQIYFGPSTESGAGVVLSNHPSDATPLLLIEGLASPALADAPPAPIAAPSTSVVRSIVRRPSAQAEHLSPRIAREFAVPEALVRAVVAVESGFDPRARSRKGAMGLMQLMPETARRFGVADPYSEEQNLRGGTAYLRWLLDAFAGDVALALAAYNAGEGAVVRAGHRIPNYPETRAYVPKVLAYQQHYADSRGTLVRR